MGKSKELATLTDVGGTIDGALTVDGGYTDLETQDVNNYARITTVNGSAQLGLYRSGSAEGGFYLGGDVDKFRVYDSSFTPRMEVDASGRVTMPYQPFMLLGTTGYTTANNANLEFNQTYQSRGLSWNTSTQTFTVPVSGVYTFSVATRLQTSGLNYIYYRIKVNGSSYPWNDMLILQKPNTLDSFQTVNTSFQVYFTANDSVAITINYNGTSSYTVLNQSWLSVALLG